MTGSVDGRAQTPQRGSGMTPFPEFRGEMCGLIRATTRARPAVESCAEPVLPAHTTRSLISPRPAMRAVMVSPRETAPTPAGVPEKITSPGHHFEIAREIGNLLGHRPDHLLSDRRSGAPCHRPQGRSRPCPDGPPARRDAAARAARHCRPPFGQFPRTAHLLGLRPGRSRRVPCRWPDRNSRRTQSSAFSTGMSRPPDFSATTIVDLENG